MTHHFLLTIVGDIEPKVRRFRSEYERDFAVAEHRRRDPELRDGLFPLTVAVGDDGAIAVTVASFSGDDSPCMLCGEPLFLGTCANLGCSQCEPLREGSRVGVHSQGGRHGTGPVYARVAVTPAEGDAQVLVVLESTGATMAAALGDLFRPPAQSTVTAA